MSDSTRRSIRTAIDLVLGVLTSLAAVFIIPGFNEQLEQIGLGKAFTWFSLVVLVLTVFFNKLKNSLEDSGQIPALLKAPASEGQNPVPDNADESEDEKFLDDEATPSENPYHAEDFDGVQDVY